MKILSPRVHGYLDYAVVVLLFAAPTLFSFYEAPRLLAYILGTFQLLMSLFTAYPLSLRKVIPFTIHGSIELVASLALLASPWLLRFTDQRPAQVFFMVSGVGLFTVWLLTNYKAADEAYSQDVVRTRHGHFFDRHAT